MNKLLQHIMNAGDVSDKFLPHLAKAKKGYIALPMYQSKGQVRERLNSFNDDYLKAKSDATRVAPQRIITNQQSFKNKLQRDAEELQRRKQAIAISNAARNKPFSAKNLADESGAIGDKLRFFPNDPDSFIDEYINPFKMIGDMASGLGRIPLNIQQGNYGQAAMAVATPLAVGALSGIGAKNVGQFANNLVNPLAGTGDLVSNLVAKRAAPVSSFQLSRLPNSFDSGVQQELYRTVDRADINTLPSLNRLRNQTINTEGIVRNTPIDYSTLVDNSRNWTGYRPKDWGASIWGTRPSSTFKPEVVNRSGLTKNEIISKAAGKDKDIVSKMSEKDFQDSVFKPTGEVSPYEQVNTYDKFTGDNEIFNMSADEYAETFNSRLDLLNDIINTNNKSGLQYNVEKLTPEGRLIFNTPKQSVPTVLNDMQKARLSEFTANPQKFISEYAPLNKLDDGTWRFPDEVELGTYTSKEDAVADFTNRINKEFGPKEISGKTDWSVGILPGQWRGTVEDVANADYYRRIPGLNMQVSSEGVFADRVARRGSGAYESINEYLKRLDLGRVKPGFNSQTDYSRGLWENAVKKGKAFGYYNNPNTVYGSMKAVAPIAIPTGIGAAALSEQRYGGENNLYKVFAEEGVEYKGPSIVDYLATKGYSGKKAFRKDLAEKYNVEDYNYSAAKNTELLNKLRADDALLQEYDQQITPIPVERMMEMERQAMAARQAAPTSNQRPANPAPVYNYSPEFQNMRIPQTKVNTSLQPKVIYDNKFSLSPQMVVQVPSVSSKPAPTARPNQPRPTAVKPQTILPKFDPFSFLQNTNQRPLGPVVLNKPAPVNRPASTEAQKVGIPGISKPIGNKFMFANEYPYLFNKQKSEYLPQVVPANKPAVKTEKYTTESEVEEKPWYEEVIDDTSNFFSRAYDSFAESVDKSPLDFRGMNFGSTGISPQGAKEMTRDLTKNILSFVSPDLAQKFENKMSRQDAINNPKERKSSLDPSKIKFDPIVVTGDTIPDTDRRYHIPELMDLDYMRFGVRNRGDYKEIQTEGAPITTFEPFQSSKQYFAKSKDPANATYIGVAPDGKIKVGGKDQFQDQEYQITKTFGNKVVDFNRDEKGVIKKVASNPNASRETLSPSVKVMGDDGKIIDGKLSLLLPREGNQEESFDLVTGGRYIFQTPDGKTKLVSGSLKNIETAFYNMKKNNPYVNVITLDNGSYARGIRTYDQKLTKQDLKGYDNQNTGGGNIAYILPGASTRYESKFSDFEKEAKARLQAKYPGKKVSVGYQDTGLYDKTGGRDIETQAAIQQKGNSQTPVSLHNFGAARDYILYVDGKPIDAGANKDLYADILWTSAAKTGLHHVGTKEDNWDPTHIGLAKEGQKTAFDELYSKYPDIFANPNFVKSLNFVNKNKSNPNYREYYELLNNIQPFTGQPRTTETMRTTAARKQEGGPIIDPRGQWAYPGKVTRIPSPNITMQGVPYPVFGVGSNGQKQMMYPEQEYNFGGASYVDEYPMMKNGGGLLSKTVSCSNCGWSWKAVEGGHDPLNCHKCGGTIKMQDGGEETYGTYNLPEVVVTPTSDIDKNSYSSSRGSINPRYTNTLWDKAGGAYRNFMHSRPIENIKDVAPLIKLFDPTGVTNWPDLYNAMTKGSSEDIATEGFASLPLIGKAGKYISIADKALIGKKTGVPLFKTLRVTASGQSFLNDAKKTLDKKQNGGFTTYFRSEHGKQPLEKKHNIKVTYKK
jgi:hypothetical protein